MQRQDDFLAEWGLRDEITAMRRRERELARADATMERLQSYTRHKRRAQPESELPWILLLDALILQAEAEVRWLDLCEARLRERENRS